ncbi:MAG: RNA polymerase sigma-70 factor [Bacteroidales bacterium]|nr:RNA polymerase sigma-70 factor [Bacteroidales bacterium]
MTNISFTNISSFKKLFDSLYEPLCRFATIYTQNSVVSEEIVQDVFVNVWEKRNTINIETSIKSYLFSSVRNRALNYKRDSKVDLFKTDVLDEIDKEIWEDISCFEGDDIEKLRNKVRLAIDDLPEKCKEIFLLSKENSLTYSEIATELSISTKTVENQMYIAFKKLRESLSPILFIAALFLK